MSSRARRPAAAAVVTNVSSEPRRSDARYVRGVTLTLSISVLWSTSPLIYRSLDEIGSFTLVFYRSLFLALGVSLFVALRYRSTFLSGVRAIGVPGATAALCLVVAGIFFIVAIKLTTIANLSFTMGATPFFTALLAWAVLRERVEATTWIAIAVAIVGIGVMVLDGLAAGSLLGNVLALGAAIASAGYAVALRFGRNVDQVPAVMVSGIFGMLLVAPVVDSFRIPWNDLALCAAQGMFISAFCNSMFTICARMVPAAELTLLSMLEIVLSPVGAWLLFTEVPSRLTLIGGGVLFAAVIGHALVATGVINVRGPPGPAAP